MLTEHAAIKIYECKVSLIEQLTSDKSIRSLRSHSGQVAKLFGVSSRIVRDIWNHKTWANETAPLCSHESHSKESKLCNTPTPLDINFKGSRKFGRKMGSRDS